MTPDQLATWIQKLPKTELHLHIEGTLEPELMFRLAERNKVTLPYRSVDQVRAAYKFRDLQSFLDIYYAACSVLREEEDFYDLTWAYLDRAARQNIRHAEIFFDPQAHTERGIAFETVIRGIDRALEDARSRLNVCHKLIMCYLRHLSVASAMKTLQQSLPYKKIITAVGLDSSEKGNPPKKFQKVFDASHQAGYLCVAHAGEEGSPDYMWQALDLLKVHRIDHGVRCLEDERLVARLIKDHIPLTVCPLSNVKLRVVDRLENHPLKKMLARGIRVTINSDDPAFFGGYLIDNILETQKALKLSSEEIIQLLRNGFEASFLPEEKKRPYLEELAGISPPAQKQS